MIIEVTIFFACEYNPLLLFFNIKSKHYRLILILVTYFIYTIDEIQKRKN